MVRDSATGNGLGHPQTADDGGSRQSGQQTPPSNLTRELAQLLAASIAQNQAGRNPMSGAVTNSDLTSLANLVSAAERQRTLAPTFKDGLSALSYGQAQARPSQGLSVEPEHHLDDEPMPIPSTWRQPAVHDDDRRWFRQQMGAAVLGLVAGLMIVVPTVLWLSGWIGGPQPNKPAGSSPAAVASIDSRPADVKTVKVQVRPVERPAERVERPVERQMEGAAQYVTGSLDGRTPPLENVPPPQQVASAAAARIAETRSDDLLAQATRRVGSGDIAGARELLAAAEDGKQGPVSFALAETYDPNMLAAWGSRGVASDVARARALYRKALDLGVPRAQARLDALK